MHPALDTTTLLFVYLAFLWTWLPSVCRVCLWQRRWSNKPFNHPVDMFKCSLDLSAGSLSQQKCINLNQKQFCSCVHPFVMRLVYISNIEESGVGLITDILMLVWSKHFALMYSTLRSTLCSEGTSVEGRLIGIIFKRKVNIWIQLSGILTVEKFIWIRYSKYCSSVKHILKWIPVQLNWL